MQERNKNKERVSDKAAAPGIDPEDSYGKKATKEEIKSGDSTMVTRLMADEYDPS